MLPEALTEGEGLGECEEPVTVTPVDVGRASGEGSGEAWASLGWRPPTTPKRPSSGWPTARRSRPRIDAQATDGSGQQSQDERGGGDVSWTHCGPPFP